jgi:hypothetical protein
MDVQRVVAVDWSGDRSVAGQRRKIWAGVWTANAAGRVHGGKVTLESGRTREEFRDWLIGMAEETPRMVVGVDFCFSYPAWFVREHGARTAPAFWKIVAEHGERWLGNECADARFWGRMGKHRSGKKPLEFCGECGHRMLRLADLACKVRGEILEPADAEKVKGIAPKSPFQIGGAGAVGTGTLRGIPFLLQLQVAGFSVWPFDAPGLGHSTPLLVEIYPRLLTGKVTKSGRAGRCDYLEDKRRKDESYASLSEDLLAKAYGSEDGFDALVSVMEMTARRDGFELLRQETDPVTLLEGAVWGAGV